MIIKTEAYPRVGLVGNPSDGYHGKTIAFTFSNFRAEVILYETPDLEILPNSRDRSEYRSINGLVEDVRLFGYYGGIRLLKATIKRFHDYCQQHAIALHDRNFTVRYDSDIPHLVGLAGSSAIITACMRALMAFYKVSIPKAELATLAWSVETKELQISAGLQDRVVQAYQGLVYMDFDRELMETLGHGRYAELDPAALPPLYIAYRADLSEVSDVYHNNMRRRFLNGDPEVLAAIENWKQLTDEARACLEQGRPDDLGALLERNFDQRRKLDRLSEGNLHMVETARSVGASAKFTGSGGAIIGTYPDEQSFGKLQAAFEPHNIHVLKPTIVPRIGE